MQINKIKEYLSGYKTWDQKEHASEWILFPDNIGPYLSLDETALSNGELYTVLTNKEGKGQKGTLITMVEGTEADKVIAVINRIPKKARELVKEVNMFCTKVNQIKIRSFLTQHILVCKGIPSPEKGWNPFIPKESGEKKASQENIPNQLYHLLKAP